MAFITFAADTGSPGTPDYQVPIVVPQAQRESVSEISPLKKLNHKLGYVITAYREGTEYYQAEHISQYRKAREILYNKNRFLAFSYAKKYKGKGIPLNDLVQGMKIALFDCTANYDPAKGEFSTIAKIYFYKTFMNLLHEEKDSIFSLPSYLFDKRENVDRIRDRLKETLQVTPTPEQIADEFNRVYPPGENENPINHKHIRGLEDYQRDPEPIDKINRKGDHLANQKALAIDDDPSKIVILSEEIGRLEQIINSGVLNEKERTIIVSYFGLFGEDSVGNFSEIGKTMGYTRQNIKHFYDKAIEKLREKMYPDESEAA